MSINFKALEDAFAPIEEIGRKEVTFDAGNTTITLRVILPSEEVEAQRYAAMAMSGDDMDDMAAVDYLDRLRTGFLSHAVVAIGKHSFRDVEYVETGETLDNGTPIKIPRYKAVRQLLSRWNRTTITNVYGKFHDLLDEAAAEAEKLIEYKPSAIPAEIERLQNRIEELKTSLDQQNLAAKAKITDRLAETDQRPAPAPTPAPAPEQPKVNPEQVLPTATRRAGPITPQAAPPPPQRQGPTPTPSPTMAMPPSEPSSFIDADDTSTMDTHLQAEHERLMERRRMAAQSHMLPPGREAPHHGARQAEDEVGFARQTARQVGEMDGAPVFAMPGQELNARREPVRADQSVVNRTAPAGGSLNPRFQPPRKP